MDEQLETKTTLRDYLTVLRRRKWLFLQAVILVPLVAVVVSHFQSAKYTASSLVLLKRQSLAATVSGTQDPNAQQDPDLLGRTQAQVARTPTLARQVLDAANVKSLGPGDLLAASSVTPVPQTDVILKFSVSNPSPTVAARLATAYAQQYALYRKEVDTAAYQAARQQIKTQLDRLRTSGVGIGSAVYADLLDRYQNLGTLVALQTSNASVLRTPTSGVQTSPRTKLNAILGAFVGIVLGFALVFLREALDRRVRSDQKLDSLLALPLLARLPGPPKRGEARGLALIARPTTAEAEAFRLLRANLELLNLDRPAKSIMVTSASRQEGKTTTIANLAVALARAGRRVVLVDLDLREPGINRAFGLGKRHGLTHVVLGDVSLRDSLVRIPLDVAEDKTAIPRAPVVAGTLDVLPVGSVPPNPSEFVGSAAVAKVLEELAETADVVLVDAPPLLAVSDAVTLGARVDAVLAVVRLNVTDREVLEDLARALHAVPCVKLGYVLTGAEPHEGYGTQGTEVVRPAQVTAEAARAPALSVVEEVREAGTSRSSRWA